MFSDAVAFNQNIGNWNVTNVTGMSYMFACEVGSCKFNQDLGQWDVSKVKHMWKMFTGVTLTTANYSNLLDGWGDRQLQKNVHFHGGNSKYSGLGRFARINIIEQFNWTIEDGGFLN
jgi:surface protein